jgi:hypothetical protein
VTDPHKLVGKLVNLQGEFGVIIGCEYDSDLDNHVLKVSFTDRQFGQATIEVSWTSVIPFLVN